MMAAPTTDAEAPAKVLVVEDEPALGETICYALRRECYTVLLATDGARALDLAESERPSIVLLDLMLPKVSGLDVCRRIRAQSTVPILILTARDSESDKVAGLELGADDYMTKPFAMRELVSRVRAQLRRAAMTTEPAEGAPLVAGPVAIDVVRHEARVRGNPVRLPPREFALLAMLVERKGRLLTRDILISELWGPDYFGDTKTLDVHIKRLRQKVEADPARPEHLITVRGLGYRFLDTATGA